MRQNVYYGRTSTSRRASLVNRLALAGVLSALLPAPATAGEMVTVAASPTESQHMRSVTMSIIPEVQFTPFPIERGQAERVWGSGFVPDLPCEVLSDAAITQPTCTTNDTGEVAGSFVAPATAGVLTVLVCQGGCKTAQAGGFDLQLVDARPEITIQPEQARPGDAVQLHGLDFLPGGVDVFALGSRSTVDDAPWGEFRLKLVVPRDITIGRQRRSLVHRYPLLNRRPVLRADAVHRRGALVDRHAIAGHAVDRRGFDKPATMAPRPGDHGRRHPPDRGRGVPGPPTEPERPQPPVDPASRDNAGSGRRPADGQPGGAGQRVEADTDPAAYGSRPADT